MLIKLSEAVKKSTGNAWFKAGAVIEVSDKYGRRLIAEGKARETIEITTFQTGLKQKFEAMNFFQRGEKIGENEEE